MQVEVFYNRNAMLSSFISTEKQVNSSDLIHVATVNTSALNIEEALEESFQKTQAVDDKSLIWNVKFHSNYSRSTSVGDVLVIDDMCYQVARSGFKKIQVRVDPNRLMSTQLDRVENFLANAQWDNTINYCKEMLDLSEKLRQEDSDYTIFSFVDYDLTRKLFKASVMALDTTATTLEYCNALQEKGNQLITMYSSQLYPQQIQQIINEMRIINYLMTKLKNGNLVDDFFIHPYPNQAEPGYGIDYIKYPDAPKV